MIAAATTTDIAADTDRLEATLPSDFVRLEIPSKTPSGLDLTEHDRMCLQWLDAKIATYTVILHGEITSYGRLAVADWMYRRGCAARHSFGIIILWMDLFEKQVDARFERCLAGEME